MVKILYRFRTFIQTVWMILSNINIKNFLSGKIYNGKLKNICVPGLNCYSCPGALGACPIGSVQAVIGSSKYKFSFYLAGFFILVGRILGRFVCGFLCPFGLIQEFLNKIPFIKKIKTFKLDKKLRYLKYFILLVFVIILPMFMFDGGSPAFCKYICPAGMLEGGIPLVITNKYLKEAVGFLFAWKGLILVLTIFLSIIIYRPFCKYICPLGAIYALFNKVAIFKHYVQKSKCTNCKACEKACPMQVVPYKKPNDQECIRCGKCIKSCNFDAIHAGFVTNNQDEIL